MDAREDLALVSQVSGYQEALELYGKLGCKQEYLYAHRTLVTLLL